MMGFVINFPIIRLIFPKPSRLLHLQVQPNNKKATTAIGLKSLEVENYEADDIIATYVKIGHFVFANAAMLLC